MRSTFLFLLTLLNVHAFAAIDFRDINGLNYYEFLGIDPLADESVLKAAYKKKMKDAHPDRGGSDEAAQNVNQANQMLRQHRQAYDRWLEQRNREQTHRHHTYRQPTEAEMIKRVMDAILKNIEESIATSEARFGQLSRQQHAELARIEIIFNQRYMPGAIMSGDHLIKFIQDYALDPASSHKWWEKTRKAIAYGTINVMAQFGYKNHLNHLERLLRLQIQGENYQDFWAEYLDDIYHFLTGQSLIAQHNSMVAQRTQSPCQEGLTTTVEVVDQYGRVWRIPITIDVKIGGR